MTRDRLGMTVPMPAVGETPVTHPLATKTPAGTWADAGAAAERAGHENFPVALRMLPRRYREHLMAVYTYARVVDDAGDEGPPEQRLQLLHELEADLRRLYGTAGTGSPPPRHPAVRGLADVVASCDIPMQPFLDLIRANEQDQVVTRYETFGELVGYCQLSANPVGRIVLHVFGCSSPVRERLSDAICTGLQVTEHLQDVAEDMRAGRIYLPAADMRMFGCTEQDLQAASAAPQLRKLIAAQARLAAEQLDAGAPLIGTLRGMPRVAIAGYVAGGRAALAAIARAGYDVLAATPRPARARTALELVSAYATAR